MVAHATQRIANVLNYKNSPSPIQQSGQTALSLEEIPDTKAGNPVNLLASLVAMWLMAYYLLPHTRWSSTSPVGMLTDKINTLSQNVPWMGSTLLLLIATCALMVYLIKPRSNAFSPSGLWMLIGVYTSFLVLPGMMHRTGEATAAVGILLPLFAGLLAARLCSNSILAVRLLILLATAQALYTLCYQKLGISLNETSMTARPSGTFNNPDVLISILLIALPLAIAETLRSTKSSIRTAASFCTVILLAALASTGSRLGLLTVLCTLGFLGMRAANRWKVPMALGLVVVGMAVCFVQWKIPSPPNLSFRSAMVRNANWQHGFHNAISKIWNGAGIGAFDKPKAPPPSTPACLLPLPPLQEPGNAFLHWLEELGIAGGVLYGFFLIAIVDALRRQEREMATVIGAAWLALLVASLFDTPFGSWERASGTAIVGMLMGATLLPSSRLAPEGEETAFSEEVRRPHPARFMPQYIVLSSMFGIAICLLWATWHSLANNRPHTAQLLDIRAQEILAGRTEYLGDAKSPYTLVEFGDYECPPCRASRTKVHDILTRKQGKLKLDFRNLPLPSLHPHAMYAASVAETARNQGNYWEIHSALFDLQLDDSTIEKLLQERMHLNSLPINVLKNARAKVDSDMQLANQLDIVGTPTFLLCCPDGKVYRLQTPESVNEIL